MDGNTNKIIINYLKPYDPKEIEVFGSYARGEMTDESDIDILYILKKQLSLFDLAEIKLGLEELLNRKVDFVSKEGLKDWIKPYVMKDLKLIYEKEFAVSRSFEVIGEATKKIDSGFRKEYPDIPWKKMAAFRDILVHDYDRTIAQILWNTAKNDLSSLKLNILQILEDES